MESYTDANEQKNSEHKHVDSENSKGTDSEICGASILPEKEYANISNKTNALLPRFTGFRWRVMRNNIKSTRDPNAVRDAIKKAVMSSYRSGPPSGCLLANYDPLMVVVNDIEEPSSSVSDGNVEKHVRKRKVVIEELEDESSSSKQLKKT